jgi:UDP-glucose 4-epimerase
VSRPSSGHVSKEVPEKSQIEVAVSREREALEENGKRTNLLMYHLSPHRGAGRKRRALITGGAGFIGSHLTELLLDKDHDVTIVDDLSTGSIGNLEHLRHRDGFAYHLDSVLNRSLMLELIDQADMVFHLAAAVGVRLIVEQPVRTIKTNIDATELVLDLCARKQRPVLIASSSEVYGKLGSFLFHEEDNLVLGSTSHSRWCYAASKIIDEFLAKAYYKERNLPAVVVRLFNTIGPRQTGQYGMVVPRFVEQAIGGEPITVYGDGTQQRSFSWVGDVVRAMLSLINTPEAHGEVFNIGHTKEISIFELAKLVKQVTNSSSGITFVPYEEAYEPGFEDITRRLPDISKLQRLTGYSPRMDLREMLEMIIKKKSGAAQPVEEVR